MIAGMSEQRGDQGVVWLVEKRGSEHVLICAAGMADQVRIDLPEGNTAVSYGQLDFDHLDTGQVVRIGTFMPSSQDVNPDEVTISWTSPGGHQHSTSRQIL